MSEGPRKPERLPSSFRPKPVEWKPIELPAAKVSGTYAPRTFVKRHVGFGRPKIQQSVQASTTPPAGVVIPTDKTLVLICDVDAGTRETIETALRAWGFTTAPAASAREALEWVEHCEAPHLAIVGTDCGDLPGMELAERLARRVPDTEFIYVGTAAEMLAGVDDARLRLPSLVKRPLTQLEELRTVVAAAFARVHTRLYAEFLVQELDRQQAHLEIEERLATELADLTVPERVMDIACQGVSELFRGAPVLFLRYHSMQNAIEVAHRTPAKLFAGAHPRLLLPNDATSTATTVAAFLEQLEKDVGFRDMIRQARALDGAAAASEEPGAWYGAPMSVGGFPYGVFAVFTPDWNEKGDRFRLRRVVLDISKHFEIAQLQQRLGENTILDANTGLANTRYYSHRLREEVQKAQRLRHPLSLLIMRIYRPLDATAADAMPLEDSLKFLAARLRASFRTTDIVTYQGGTQFGAVLPHTSFADAIYKAELFRKQVAEASEGRIVLAIGVAECPGHAADPKKLHATAEAASVEAAGAAGVPVTLARAPEAYVPPYFPEGITRGAPPKPAASGNA
jgi:diguanylate cyclase (GGDEF)-like protein